MKITIAQSKDSENGMEFTKVHIEKITSIAPDVDVTLINSTKEALTQVLPQTDILLFSGNFNDIEIENADNLKWIQITSAGATTIAERLRDTPILLTSASGVHPIPIAEHVMTFILMFSREFHKSYRTQIINKSWGRDRTLRPLELKDKTLSIVGYGRIGKRVAHLAKGFGMTVLALSHREVATDSHVDTFYSQENVSELLSKSDFVVNCLPHTDETEHYFTKNKLNLMKPTSYFINIGRGKTVDESALIEALQKGTITGAGLDVFDEEPLPDSSPLWNLDNVILTPHYAGWTPEYSNRVIEIFCKNLHAFINNEQMPTLVDKEKGY